MTTPFYIQRGEMRNQIVWFLTLFLFWLKFDCSRLSHRLIMRGFCFRSSHHLWLWSSAKDVSAWCKHRGFKKAEDVRDRMTFEGMQGTNQALKSKLVLDIPLFFLLMVTDHPYTPQHLMIR